MPGVRFPSDQAGTLEDLQEQTAELRGLQPKSDIEKRLIGRGDAADYLESTLDPGDREVLKLHEEVYKALGLIPDDADLIKLQITLLRGAVLGFYDPDVKALFILQDLGLTSVVTRTTIVHEITHALQDQYYDLDAIELRIRDNWDAYMAYVDVVEGDARTTETLFSTPSAASNRNAGCDDSSFAVNRNSSIPVIIQRELLSPYSTGMCMISRDRSSLPGGVDSILQDLPRSTEQVLHPEKYLAREEPRSVMLRPLTDVLSGGWKQLGSSTFGEFGLQNLLLLGITDTATVKRGADGWGGDGWALYGKDDGSRLVQLTTGWDSEAEAREFWGALLLSLNSRSNGRVRSDASVGSVIWDQSGKSLRAAIAGDSVTIVMSNDADAAGRAAQALNLG